MYEFHDLTLRILDALFTLLSTYNKQLHFSYMEAFSIGKSNDFWAVGKCSKLVCKFSGWNKKSLSDF